MTGRSSRRAQIFGRLLGLALEMPPAFYIAVTGHAPAWARIWLAVWLSIWALITVISATAKQATEAAR